jgi:hypothetical protein
MVVVVVRYETTATARWALLFIVRAFFNDTITVAVWTGFHGRLTGMLSQLRDYIRRCFADPPIATEFISLQRQGRGGGVYLWETREAAENCYFTWGESVRRASGGNEPEIAWFETGVVVDNESRQIKTAT